MKAAQTYLEFLGGPLDGGVVIWPEGREVPEIYWCDHIEHVPMGEPAKRHLYHRHRGTIYLHKGVHDPTKGSPW